MDFRKEYDEVMKKMQQNLSPSSGKCIFMKAKPSSEAESSHSHDHSHGGHGHTHEHWRSPGDYATRDLPLHRTDFHKRAFTVGIGGPVGSGKTALILSLCKVMREKYNLCIVTNDIFTREDWEFLVKNKALPAERIRAVETGGCPHAAIREDYSLNMEIVKDLTKEFQPNMIFLESGGDNLAANFSRDLADYIIYVIDVAGGDKIPRKGGPGITESDLLVINKVDLADAVGASIQVMKRDAEKMRDEGPSVITEATHMKGVETVATHIVLAYREMVDKSIKLPFF